MNVRITYEDDDTERFTAEALKDKSKADAIVIAGGDGSINQVGLPGQLLPGCVMVCCGCMRCSSMSLLASCRVPRM